MSNNIYHVFYAAMSYQETEVGPFTALMNNINDFFNGPANLIDIIIMLFVIFLFFILFFIAIFHNADNVEEEKE
jgi:ABC-type Na+ efflux pump permease subunit